MVVDARSMTCSSMTVEQQKDIDGAQNTLKIKIDDTDDKYDFMSTTEKLEPNQIICGAKLPNQFDISKEGIETFVTVVVEVKYETGETETRRILIQHYERAPDSAEVQNKIIIIDRNIQSKLDNSNLQEFGNLEKGNKIVTIMIVIAIM